MRPYERGDTAAAIRALWAERDAAIAARDEAIRMMGEASRQAGSWQGISEGKDIALRQLEAERDAAVHMSRNLAHALGEARVEVAALQTKLRAASLDRLAANDAPLLDAESAYRAGAEAMRRAAADETDCGCGIRDAVLARLDLPHGARKARHLCGHDDACLALQAAAIRDLPLPKMEDTQ
jgi:hypothetical protein